MALTLRTRNLYAIGSMLILLGLLVSMKVGFYFNLSESLPGHAFLVIKGKEPRVGEMFAFRYHGDQFFPKDAMFVKILRGKPGDRITIKGREVFLDSFSVGTAKETSKAGIPLNVTSAGVIPDGKLYAFSPHHDSYDSRYESFGLVDKSWVIGTVWKVF